MFCFPINVFLIIVHDFSDNLRVSQSSRCFFFHLPSSSSLTMNVVEHNVITRFHPSQCGSENIRAQRPTIPHTVFVIYTRASVRINVYFQIESVERSSDDVQGSRGPSSVLWTRLIMRVFKCLKSCDIPIGAESFVLITARFLATYPKCCLGLAKSFARRLLKLRFPFKSICWRVGIRSFLWKYTKRFSVELVSPFGLHFRRDNCHWRTQQRVEPDDVLSWLFSNLLGKKNTDHDFK